MIERRDARFWHKADLFRAGENFRFFELPWSMEECRDLGRNRLRPSPSRAAIEGLQADVVTLALQGRNGEGNTRTLAGQR